MLDHYGDEINRVLKKYYEARKGECDRCITRCNSFHSYKYHTAVKHKLLSGFIKTEFVSQYEKIFGGMRLTSARNKLKNPKTIHEAVSQLSTTSDLNQTEQVEVIQLLESPEHVSNKRTVIKLTQNSGKNKEDFCDVPSSMDQKYNSVQRQETERKKSDESSAAASSVRVIFGVANIQTNAKKRDDLVSLKPLIDNQFNQEQIYDVETSQLLQSSTGSEQVFTHQGNESQTGRADLREVETGKSNSLIIKSVKATLPKVDANSGQMSSRKKVLESPKRLLCPECGILLSSPTVLLMVNYATRI